MKAADLPGLLGVPLSDEQLQAATAPRAPQLIVAGAGTGKTTVMAARVVWLIATGQVRPDQVLGLTFTTKAATELRARVRRGLTRLPRDADAGEPTVLTYHAYAARLLAEYGALLGIEADSRVLSDGQRGRLAYGVACRPLDASGLQGSPQRLAERLLGMDDALADLDVATADVRGHDSELLAFLAEVRGPRSIVARMRAAAQERLHLVDLVDQFREAKLAGEYLDFADQVRLAADLARSAAVVGDRARGQYGVVLLDEYQDTSRAQRRMLQALFGGGHPVTAVGDPCQAIYGWRGASVTNIDEFPVHFAAPDGAPAATYRLTVNRRSLPGVLSVANDVAADLRRVHPEARPLRAPTTAAGGRVTTALLGSEDEELVWLGDRLAEATQRHAWHDMAVLCRSNDQVAAVVDHLRTVGVPAHVASRRDLLALPEVVAVISWLTLLVDPGANPDVLAQLTGPRWRIGPRDLAALATRARELADRTDSEVSLLDAVYDPGDRGAYSPQAWDRVTAFAAELDRFARLPDRPLADVVADAVELLAPGLAPADAVAVPAGLPALVEMARQYRSLAGSRSLPDFLAYVADCRRFRASPADPHPVTGDGVAVMTIHAAKGLEFPLVALPFLCAGVFPNARGDARWVTSADALPPVVADEPDPALLLGFPGTTFTGKDHDAYLTACRQADRHDEDRLAYVAVTRAERELVASGHWWGPTQKSPRGPSDYLTAIHAASPEGESVWLADPPEREEPTEAARLVPVWPPPIRQDGVAALADEVVRAVADPPPARPDDPLLQAVADLAADHREPAGEPPDLLSVSGVVAWLRDPAAAAAAAQRPMPRRPSRAAARGTAFHRWVENRLGQQTLFDLDPSGEEFAQLLQRTEYADRTPHAVEQPFVIDVGGVVVTGRIDAVFRVTDDPDHEWEVVDWKTGRGGDPAQLAVYREAWARLVSCDPVRVRATFVHLADGSHTRFADLPPAREVVEQVAGRR